MGTKKGRIYGKGAPTVPLDPPLPYTNTVSSTLWI